MENYGVFKNGKLILICEGKEKAEEMAERYDDGEAFPVEEVNREWIKKNQ